MGHLFTEAANRFYKTKSEEESICRSGKAEDKKENTKASGKTNPGEYIHDDILEPHRPSVVNSADSIIHTCLKCTVEYCQNALTPVSAPHLFFTIENFNIV